MLCPTYNRPPRHLGLLKDCVESFRRQDLPLGVSAELVILNDAPGQELLCDVPGVVIVNAPRRFPSLGEKYSDLVSLARFEILMPAEDDDLSLPRRIEQALTYLSTGHHYFNPGWTWYEELGKPPRPAGGVCHNASAYTRFAYEAVGGFYAPLCGGQDADMDRRLREKFGCNEPVKESHYVYRWGVQPYHLSGVADYTATDPHAEHYRRIGEQPIATGVFDITPGWRQDYVAMCRKALR